MFTPPAQLCRAAPAIGVYFFGEISTEARVVSQSMRSVQPPPVWSNAIVKFSTADGLGRWLLSCPPIWLRAGAASTPTLKKTAIQRKEKYFRIEFPPLA